MPAGAASAPRGQRCARRSERDTSPTHRCRRGGVAVPPPRFARRPELVAPAGHRRVIALPSAPRGFWEVPAERLAAAAARGERGGDAKREAPHGGEAAPGPPLTPDALGCGAWRPPRREVGAWRVGQPGRGTRGGPMAQRCRAPVTGACHPRTHGACAAPEGRGDLALGPALRCEVPGSEPSGCSPVAGCMVHAGQYSTDTPRA